MATDRFLIAPFDSNSGLQTSLKPFMIPDEAFAALNNAYCWRGRIRKRFGSRWLGNTQDLTRLRIGLVTTNGSGNASNTVPGIVFAIGQMFSIGSSFYTVYQTGTPAAMLIDGTGTTATYNTTTGAYVFTGAPANTQVFFYPALPVMGLATFQNNSVNNEPLIAFDTQFAYQYNSGWDRLATGAALWAGSNSQFFWFTTYSGANASDYVLFVTNFNENEPMRYLFGTTWSNFAPRLSATGPLVLVSARILVIFKNRMLAFNTWESSGGGAAVNYSNRMRYSGANISPIDAGGNFPWNQDTPGPGGGQDCPSKEAIITVEFVKDRLVVFLEQSTWEIVFTNNQQQPFAWQQINTELGAESTFSIVPFDKVAIGVGNVGIIACTGANVERIDDKIPDEVFSFHNVDAGVERVYGIRDYFVEMIYWTIPTTQASSDFPYPNKVLVYNYKNGTWALNDDSITAFGYFQPQTNILWSSTTVLWSSDDTWGSGSLQALFRQVVAGNQQGWTFIVDAQEQVNAPALQITNLLILVAGSNIVTIDCINHNLHDGDYVYFQDIAASGNLTLLNGKIFPVIVSSPENPHTFSIDFGEPPPILAGTYRGGGVMARVSQIQVLTKQYNFYMDQGRNAYVSKVDFLVDRTQDGEIQVDYYVSTSDLSMLADSAPEPKGTGALLGTGVLETFPYPTVPFEASSSQLWHPYYLQADGEFIQLNIQLNDTQMRDPLVRLSPFQLHKLLFYATQSSSRLQ